MSHPPMSRPRGWQDLSIRQRAGVVATIIVQVTLLGAALWDIRRRPAAQIRGSKRMWTAIAFVNYVGPIAYFAFGRRKPV
jgi:hypothetical protein